MKNLTKYLFGFVLLSSLGWGQSLSDISVQNVPLTSTCTNTNISCDTAGVTNFVINSSFNVQGPQTLEVTTQGYGLIQMTFQGTYSGATENFEVSNDGGTTWFTTTCTRIDTNIQETSETITANAYRGIECSVGAGTKFRVRQSAIGSGGPTVAATLTSGLVEAAPTVQLSLGGVGGSNPCANPHAALSSALVSLSGTTLTQSIALSGSTRIYICDIIAGWANAAGTVVVSYGTGANCGTGTQAIGGTLILPASSSAPTTLPDPFFVTPPGQALCYTLATSTSGTLIVNYMQQ